ncbi:MAG: hypothetical protein ACRC6E_04840, partial [Fusobacteriaceae bacterium]
VMRVSNLLRVAKLKVKYDFYESKEIYELNDEDKLKFKKIATITLKIFQNFYFEDIFSLLLILKNHVSSSEIISYKYKRLAIIDDTFDNMYSSAIIEYLKKYSYIEVVKTIKSYEVCKLLEDVFEIDYIVMIHDLQDFNLNIPLIKINRKHFLDNSFQLSELNFILK